MSANDKLTFKVLKSGLKVAPEDGSWAPLKLSYPMWDILGTAKPAGEVYNYIEFKNPNALVVAPYMYREVRESLEARGVLSIEYLETKESSNRYYAHYSKTEVQVLFLTPIGIDIVTQMPKCPEREEWPKSKPRKVGPDHIRLSAAQLDILKKWTKRESLAIPFGEKEPASSWWFEPPRQYRPSYQALEKMLLIEPGLAGIAMEGGVVTRYEDPEKVVPDPDTHRDEEVAVVYRLTVHGALMKG